MIFLTHILTHTGKSLSGISGTRCVKEDADSQWKGPKMSVQHHLKGFCTFRNQQVARSSRVTSSRKKRLPGLGAFFLSGASGFATRAKPAPAGGFPLRSDVAGTYGSPHKRPLPFPGNSVCKKTLTHSLTHKRKYPETIRNPRRAAFICFLRGFTLL